MMSFLLMLVASTVGFAERPNVLIIMADDMGYSDIGCYGGEIKTPRLDQLAANGLRFTHFYNTSRCCPTRASLLTGRYAHQSGVGHMMNDRGHDGYRGELSRDSVTIAEVLGASGYATALSGKWHVTFNYGDWAALEEPESIANWPTDRGFDWFYGTLGGGGDFFNPASLARGEKYIERDCEDFYYTDRISEEAVSFIASHDASNDEQPFLLYVAYTAPHWPLHAREEDVAACAGRYDAGWDAMRVERHERMKTMGLVDPAWPLTPRDKNVKPWNDIKAKAWQVRRMEVYAAQVESLDRGVGVIVDALEAAGELDNTLFVFLADNGGCAEELGKNAGRLSRPNRTHDDRPVAHGNNATVMPGPQDTFQSCGIPWANVSNTPFRRYKHHVHEGGIASPFIVHWPDGFSARGELRDTPAHVIDLMATAIDVGEATYPAMFNGHTIGAIEGKSIRAAFDGKPIEREALYWEHEGNRAVRQGRWKLVARHKGKWELYDLEADRTELNSLASDEPDRVAAMTALYETWAKRADVLPWPP